MRRISLVAIVAVAILAAESRAIEMFTFYGDGSRIGLPNLEVPIEAYPGIPLRSDRIRARRRAMQTGSAVRVGPGTPVGSVTIRPMPTRSMPSRSMPTTTMPETVAQPVAEPIPAPRPQAAPTENDDKPKTTSRPVAD
ncbi:MAG: hypothetical protein WCO76_07720 [Planctomycetota bacterium]